MTILRRAEIALPFFVSITLAACSSSSPVGTPNDAGSGGSSGAGGSHSGGAGGASGNGGIPPNGGGPTVGGAPGTGGAPPASGGTGGSSAIVAGCTSLCTTILGAGCPNGPGLNACVQNCASAGTTCKAAQQCFSCTGTAPRVVCDDAGVPQVPECPECADVADRCASDGSVDAGADASDAASGAKDAGAERDGKAPKTDASPRDAGHEEKDARTGKAH